MFENLSAKLEKAIKNLKGQGRISEINVAETTKEIRRALVDADVNYKIAKEVTDTIKEKSLGSDVLTSVSPGQLFTKIVFDELVSLLGSNASELIIDKNPNIILVAGLQGSGKTTLSGKLAKYIQSKGRKCLLVGCDVYRPAAMDQLKVLGDQIGVNTYLEKDNKNPIDIAKNAIKYARENALSAIIVDTAGRLSIDEAMMNEVAQLKLAINPTETLLVLDSMTGQDAVNTAENFNNRLEITGIVLTKLDGDTKGGAALSIKKVVNKPIKLVSTGEKLEALDIFYPDRMANRILGMGDIVSLVEKAQAAFDEEEAEKLRRKMAKDAFDLEDFLAQIQQIKKMGNIKDLMSMIPGLGNKLNQIDISNESFKSIEAIIQSMTRQERQMPDLINGSRRNRIAAGSGTSVQEINKLLNQYYEMKKMMKKMNMIKGKKSPFM